METHTNTYMSELFTLKLYLLSLTNLHNFLFSFFLSFLKYIAYILSFVFFLSFFFSFDYRARYPSLNVKD